MAQIDEETLKKLNRNSTELIWLNRIQTAALLLSFFGIVTLTGIFVKSKRDGK